MKVFRTKIYSEIKFKDYGSPTVGGRALSFKGSPKDSEEILSRDDTEDSLEKQEESYYDYDQDIPEENYNKHYDYDYNEDEQ